MANRILLPLCALFVVGALLYLITPAPLPALVVYRTDGGFVPTTLRIRQGQAVIFKNDSSAPIWPASDFHPTHSLYPEFDPKAQIAPGQSWRFVFKKAGTWTYHDHLDESVHGTVQVLGSQRSETTGCSSGSASSTAACWAAALTTTLNTKGLDAAFDLYRSFYLSDPAFRGFSCHDAGHVLGAAAYKLFKNDHAVTDRPETSYCGYGFYHGFMETMLNEEGAGHYDDVRNYCESMEINGHPGNRANACFHGIGHAVFDSLPGKLWGDAARMVTSALATCHAILPDPTAYHQCSTGVFNSLANAMSAHSYQLSYKTSDPLWICRIQPHAIQDGCYREIGNGAIRDAFLDRTASIAFIRSAGDSEKTSWVLNAYAGDEATRHISDMDSLKALCNAFPGTTLEESCVDGVLFGLNVAGEPGREYASVFLYCDSYAPPAVRNFCFAHGTPLVRTKASDKDAFMVTCKTVAPDPKICTM